MAKNQDNLREWNAEDSAVYVAPKGTTLPEDSLEIPALFEEIGWISDGGVEESIEVESKETKAWQGGTIVKMRNTSTKKSHKFASLEDSATNTGLYYGHDKPTLVGEPGSQVARVDMPKSIPTIEKTIIIKLVDNAGYTRLKCIESAAVSERGTYVTNVEDDPVYEFGFTETGESWWLTDEPAFLEAAA